MKINRLVVRLKNKTLLKGKTSDFYPDNKLFNMELLSGDVVPVDIEKLKAVFFVKSFEGNKNYKYTYKDVIPWENHKVKIEFIDGEVMIGYIPYYHFCEHGFLMTPADMQGNNKKVFIITSATRAITFM